MLPVCLIVDIFNECMNRGTDVGKGLTYLLATGNIATKSGLGLMQVKMTTLHAMQCSTSVTAVKFSVYADISASGYTDNVQPNFKPFRELH